MNTGGTDTPQTDSLVFARAISKHWDDAKHWREMCVALQKLSRQLERKLAATTEAPIKVPDDWIADKIIADYLEHYSLPNDPQGESHLHDCIMDALKAARRLP